MIANSRMYSVAPSADSAWKRLFQRAADQSGIELDIIDHPAPARLADLWNRADCACVFMCGLPYIRRTPSSQLLAAPVPLPARYRDRPIYFSEFLVRADAPYRSLSDTFGLRFACMLPESNSGYNAPRHHLLSWASPSHGSMYRPARTPTPTPVDVINAIKNGDADVGVVDSYWLDLARRHRSALTDGLRTIAVTEASPIPPLVASPDISPAAVELLAAALCRLHRDPQARTDLAELLLSRFERIARDDYCILLDRAALADQRGFELTAS